MATTLEILIKTIDPSRTIERVSAAVDEAFNSFKDNSPIRAFDDYGKYMSKYVQHIEQIVLKFQSASPYNQEFFWGRYVNLVSGGYERETWKWNYRRIMTGEDGGLYGVLKEVASLILKDRSGNEISSRIYTFWNSLDTQEKFAAIDEFIRKFGNTLPSKFTDGRTIYLKMHFPQFLEKYPQFLLEMRRSIR